MKKIDYKKEIKRALEKNLPYNKSNWFFPDIPNIILYCLSSLVDLNSWVGKTEIYEVLTSYTKNKKPNYEKIMLTTSEINNIIKSAKEYIDLVWKRKENLNRLSKLIGVNKDCIRQISDDEFIVSLNADNMDKSIEGFKKRAKEYVKNLNLSKEIEVLEIFPFTLIIPMDEEDFKLNKKLKECYVKKTKEEFEKDKKESEMLKKIGVFSAELDSPYKMVKYAGINLRVRVKSLR